MVELVYIFGIESEIDIYLIFGENKKEKDSSII